MISMQRVFRFGEKTHGLKLVAAFLIIMSILGVLVSVANILQTWSVLSRYDLCYNDVNASSYLCKDLVYRETGLILYPGQVFFNSNQMVMIAFKPMIPLFFWLAVFVLSVMLYRFGHHILPLPEKENSNKKGKK